ncbi:MAG TPA: S-layer homology domain-containing protein [Candidatus Obscuribacterales bacterium]
MKAAIITIGLAIFSSSLSLGRAIASEATPPAAMTDLPLPTLVTAAPSSPVTPAPTLAEVLPSVEFTDLSPNHWAYPAVTNLADSYGCLAGYPDGTFRGDEAVTRYEFAAALEACLTTLLEQATAARATQTDATDILSDLDALQRELGTLTDTVDGLEADDAPVP